MKKLIFFLLFSLVGSLVSLQAQVRVQPNNLEVQVGPGESFFTILDENSFADWDFSLFAQEHFLINETNVGARFAILKGGNVGIGVINPIFRLTVADTSYFGTTFSLQNTSTGGNAWTLFSTGQGNTEGAGKLLFHDGTANEVRMILDNAGRVGIGNTNPLNTLSVGGFTDVVRLGIGTDDVQLPLSIGDSDTGFKQEGDGILALYTNFVEAMRVDTNQNVGIGVTNPLFKLTVGGSSHFGTTFSLQNTSTGGNARTLFSTGQANTEGAGKLLFHDGAANEVRMTLSNDGELGVGTTDPEARIHAFSDLSSTNMEIAGKFVSNYRGVEANVQTGDNAAVKGIFSVAQSSNESMGLHAIGAGATTQNNYGVYADANNSGAGSAFGVYGNTTAGAGARYAIYGNSPTDTLVGSEYAGYFNGDVTVMGVFNNPSDQKLKRGIQDSGYGLETILSLRPVTYEFRKEEYPFMALPTGQQIGFVAQEFAEVLPQLVKENEHPLDEGTLDYKAINYQGLIPVMTKALQERHEVITVHESRISELELKNEELQMQLDELKNLVSQLVEEKAPTQHGSLSSARLDQNEPNPFTRATRIKYFVPDHIREAELRVYDQQGRLIKTFAIAARGEGETMLQTNSLSTGQYYYTLSLDGEILETKKMILNR